MRRWIAVLILTLGTSPAWGQRLDPINTSNGACNAPCATLTRYFNSPAIGELLIVEAGWGGQSLKVTISDGVNTYHRLSGPTDVGSTMRSEIWYAINTGNPQGVTITVDGPTLPGWFDGILIQSIGVSGINRKNPIDLKTIATNTGAGRNFTVTSGALQSSHEMLFGLFIESAAGAPYSVPQGWTEIGGGEAVTLSEYAVIPMPGIQPITGTAQSDVAWAGVAIGINPAP